MSVAETKPGGRGDIENIALEFLRLVFSKQNNGWGSQFMKYADRDARFFKPNECIRGEEESIDTFVDDANVFMRYCPDLQIMHENLRFSSRNEVAFRFVFKCSHNGEDYIHTHHKTFSVTPITRKTAIFSAAFMLRFSDSDKKIIDLYKEADKANLYYQLGWPTHDAINDKLKIPGRALVFGELAGQKLTTRKRQGNEMNEPILDITLVQEESPYGGRVVLVEERYEVLLT